MEDKELITNVYKKMYEGMIAKDEKILDEVLDDSFVLVHMTGIWIDVVLKVCGLLLSITVFPPATSIAVLVTLLVLVIPNQLKQSE